MLRVAAASNALGGRLEKAQRAIARLLGLDPAFRISSLVLRIACRFADQKTSPPSRRACERQVWPSNHHAIGNAWH
jgi:hypothetical protein